MSSELIHKIIQLYPIAEGVKFGERVTEGFLSHNYILASPTKKFFLKQYSEEYSWEILNDIHKVKFFFANSGIPVILPYEDINKGTIFEFKEKYFSLFPFAEGKILSREKLTKREFCNLGKLLAEVHILSREKLLIRIEREKGKWSKEKFLEKSKFILEKIKTIEKKTEFDKLTLSVLNKKFEIVMKNNLIAEDLGLTNDHLLHGDYHEKNVFFNDDGSVKYLFDWEKTCLGPRAFELARAIDLICLDGNYEKKNIDSAKWFLDGYMEIYPIKKDEFIKGMTYYFIKKAHSLWIETEHYINNTQRVDGFFQREFLMLSYYHENFDLLVNSIYGEKNY